MTRRLLVVTTVHPADDPRIREKHIRTLGVDFDVTYATKAPPPSDTEAIEWRVLSGGRVARWFAALRLMLTARADVIAIHDPELIPAGIVASVVRRIPVVFDMHENVPALARTRVSVPTWLRWPFGVAARGLLAAADRMLVVTVAEAGYGTLLNSEPPVFPNFLDESRLPEVPTGARSGVIYVGDVTEQRGAVTILKAVASVDAGPLTYVGRCSPDLRRTLLEQAAALGVDIELAGWTPHAEAMEMAGSAAVGVSPLHDLPNYRHSLPTKTLEYLAMGTPVVASDLPGTRAVIGSLPGATLVPPGGVAALANALVAVDEDAIAAASAGAPEVRRRFRWPADEVRTLYASLIDE
ncbi:MAG: glycosyltransferase [Actinomycetota bacterium]|nr:glycosyltransferase [Actinomycetota bacterium]